MSTTSPLALTLHVWPSQWGLSSIEPSSLAAVFYLQLAVPGRFVIRECTNPDLSPTGQLPYLTHGHHIVAPAASIFKYVAALAPASLPHAHNAEQLFSADLDVMLSSVERARRTAWCAHVESTLGDLLAHAFYSLPANYAGVTQPAFASFYSAPLRYYVPQRIRKLYHARLEANGLWNLPGEEIEDKEAERRAFGSKEKPTEKDPKKIFKSAFERERVLEKARDAFDLYTRLLGDNQYFFYDRPTTLDAVLAAHILLLTTPSFPDPLLSSLVSSSYTTLIAHAHRVLAAAHPPAAVPPPSISARDLLPYPSVLWASITSRTEKTAEEKEFDKMRWRWIGLALLSTIVYSALWGPRIQIKSVDELEANEVIEDEEDDDADEEEDPPAS
ncbi:hypothetical protein FA95DRAFT_1505676 [Auriscalpium vulgare]|uniref:Uncharacterized protein n=1 Tax=Auriscalpium vulgare TaxID=40419 RepID=A0ACB8R3R0_9AGAM|nr:hypothetical protein FA95DRAFT_1505676 [Auriscalpium vulgare]